MTGQAPAFSVVIPTYNRAHLLPRAIQSVLRQSFAEFELIVVDDHSTDDTPQVVRAFSDPRLVYVRREQNGGASATRNSGIRRSRGQYVAFLDDDDEYRPPFLAEMHQALATAPDTVGFGWSGVRVVQDTPQGQVTVEERYWQPRFQNRQEAYLTCLRAKGMGSNDGLTVRRAAFEVVGLFDEALQVGEDADFLVRMVRHFDFRVVPRPLVIVHLHPGPKLNTYTLQKAQSHERILAKNLAELRPHQDLWRFLHYKVGWLYYKAGYKGRGRRFMWQALRKNPWDLKGWLRLVLFELFGPRTRR